MKITNRSACALWIITIILSIVCTIVVMNAVRPTPSVVTEHAEYGWPASITDTMIEIPLADVVDFNEAVVSELSLREGVSVGRITIWNSGEVSYPSDASVSEAAKEFWEAVIEAYPDIEWGPKGNEWFHIVYKTNLGQPIIVNVEFPSSIEVMDWLRSIGATSWEISKMGSRSVP